uniref:RING-type domain-containing protein n=1 Tax=Oreochromis aureus TaxID=47969 RepID=A0AAZ1X9C2_OREAU
MSNLRQHYMENGHEATQECPVCFENVLDCLSKIMLVAKSQGSIVCPLCRQATYLNKQNQAGETLAADVSPTEEAPLPLPMGYLVMASRASIVGLLHGGNLMMHHLRRLSQRSSEQTVANRNGSQVFIISDQVRPTTRNDTAVSIPEPESSECFITQCSVFCLVVVFCLIALLWVLVSRLSACLDFIQSQDRHVIGKKCQIIYTKF